MVAECQLLGDLLRYLGQQSKRYSVCPERQIDWSLFLDLVRRHRLAGLFYRELQDSPWRALIPPRIWEDLKEEFHSQLARTVLNQDQLHRILSFFKRKGIDSIVLKGSHLAEGYYPHPALRPGDDIDILIQPRDRESVYSFIEENNWKFLSGTPPGYKGVFLNLKNRYQLFLEVYTDLQTGQRRNPSFAVKVDDFWQSARQSVVAGVPTRVLEPTLNLFYLSAHLSQHGLSRLLWFYDLHLVITKSGSEINWDELVKKSIGYRSAPQVYYALFFTREFFQDPVPETVLESLSPAPYKKILARPFLNKGQILKGEVIFPLLVRFMLNDNWLRAANGYLFSRHRQENPDYS
jgi:hypothetical protein